ncbi:hypothetical protein [Micromonospora maris]|uniref:Uncharacterized protein n=1 Tax=Micromonospora maris TaxID=1003110 RepID=A0A9X0I5Z3_9ACTN|nr:hypothetical protein [Micromonospora maris]AEB42129.1 hypothetical protein VAB18032_05015 [Micromonospora maris AB-18-032]KUJ47653.1 hypothetical protein ADL17_00525 [Micromonospora maris]
MTSEGPHHPGHEPDEVPPGGGGSAPYGDRPVQQENGYGAPASDLGWAPPPPARPDQAAPAWASQPGAGWGNQQANRQAQAPSAGTWTPAGGQQSWNPPGEQPAANWPAASTSDQPAWANAGQSNPAWGGAPTSESTQPAEWTPHQTSSDQSASSQSGSPPASWQGNQQPEWNTAPRPGEQPPGWAAGAPESAQPDWAQAKPAQPDWAQANPPSQSERAQSNSPAQPNWTQSSPPAQPDWAQGSAPAQPDWAQGNSPAQPDWAQAKPAQPDWAQANPPAQPDWAQTSPAAQPEWAQGGPSAQPDWAQTDQAATRGEPAARATAQVPPADPAPQQHSAPGDPARAGAWPGEQQEQPGWPVGQGRQPEPAGWAQDQAPAWTPTEAASGSASPLPSRNAADRAPLTEIEPWAPGEAWGGGGAPEAGPSRSDTGRAEESPVYQPAPAPGISPANMVPLPPQEQRIPGASLAAAPPADYSAPGQYPGDQSTPGQRPGADQPAGSWGQPESRPDEPKPPAEASIPAPRTSPESVGRATPPTAAAGGVSASASVPTTSRVTPPADHTAIPTSTPAPRVYGRPARPEPEEPVQEREEQPQPPRFGQGPEPRFADHEQAGPSAFTGAAAPASPAFPPGLPAFADAPATDRPVNGVKPHPEPERPADRFGGPAGDPFGSPAGDPYGGAARDPFGGPTDRPGVTYGSPARPESGPDHTSAFPPGPQANAPWSPGTPAAEPEQGRFDAFKPVAEPAADAPPPKVRNGRVLAAVLVAAVLILAIPLGLLLLLGKFGGSDDNAFDPAVGSCVKRSGDSAVEAVCGEPESFSVVSKVESKDKCPDPALPYVELRGDVANPVLCLKNSAG